MTDDFLQRFEERRAAQAETDRTFPLAGETLTHRLSVVPEVGYRLEQAQIRYAAELTAVQAEMKKLQDDKDADVDMAVLEALTPDWELIKVADDTVRACLEPESLEAWDRLRSEDHPNPLSFQEIFEVAGYLLGRVSGIPTVAPSGSSGGRAETASPSKAASSSPAKTPTRSRSATS